MWWWPTSRPSRARWSPSGWACGGPRRPPPRRSSPARWHGMPKIDAWLDGLPGRVCGRRVGDPCGDGRPAVLPASGAGVHHRGAGRVVPPWRRPRPLRRPVDRRRARPVRTSRGTGWTPPAPPSWSPSAPPTPMPGARFLDRCADGLRARADRFQAVIVDPAGVLRRHGGRRRQGPARGPARPATRAAGTGGRGRVPRRAQHRVRGPVARRPARRGARSGTTSPWSPRRWPTRARASGSGSAGSRAAGSGAAIDAVLDEPGHRAAAERVGAAFRAAGGAGAAATTWNDWPPHGHQPRQQTP